MTVGTDKIHNTGDEPVTVTNVVLVDAHGVSLIDSFVLPMPSPSADGSLYMVGTKGSYPPQDAGPDWDKRAPAVGAIVSPNQQRAFVFGIKSDASSTLEKVTVEYKDSSGNRYEASTSTKIVVKPQCS